HQDSFNVPSTAPGSLNSGSPLQRALTEPSISRTEAARDSPCLPRFSLESRFLSGAPVRIWHFSDLERCPDLGAQSGLRRILIRSLSPIAIAFEMALASLRSTPDYSVDEAYRPLSKKCTLDDHGVELFLPHFLKWYSACSLRLYFFRSQ